MTAGSGGAAAARDRHARTWWSSCSAAPPATWCAPGRCHQLGPPRAIGAGLAAQLLQHAGAGAPGRRPPRGRERPAGLALGAKPRAGRTAGAATARDRRAAPGGAAAARRRRRRGAHLVDVTSSGRRARSAPAWPSSCCSTPAPAHLVDVHLEAGSDQQAYTWEPDAVLAGPPAPRPRAIVRPSAGRFHPTRKADAAAYAGSTSLPFTSR